MSCKHYEESGCGLDFNLLTFSYCEPSGSYPRRKWARRKKATIQDTPTLSLEPETKGVSPFLKAYNSVTCSTLSPSKWPSMCCFEIAEVGSPNSAGSSELFRGNSCSSQSTRQKNYQISLPGKCSKTTNIPSMQTCRPRVFLVPNFENLQTFFPDPRRVELERLDSP